jgi:hypothetical protein
MALGAGHALASQPPPLREWTNGRMDEWTNGRMNGANRARGAGLLPPWALLALYAAVLSAYLYQGLVPAFNADDLIQLQEPQDAANFLAQGRWGYYLVFAVLQGSNPLPLLATLLGAGLLLASGLLAAHLMHLREPLAVAALVLLASISPYYGALFSFDSTRIAYPLANLLAIAGLYALLSKRPAHWLAGVFLLALSPAFYPAAIHLVAVVLLARALVELLHCGRPFAPLPLLRAALGLLAGLLAYLALTALLRALLDWPAGARTDFNLSAAVERRREILCLFSHHSLPFLKGFRCRLPMEPVAIRGVVQQVALLGFLSFNVFALWRLGRDGRWRLPAFALLQFLLLLAPFFLILVSASSPFPPRSLYPLAMVYAFFLAYLIQQLASAMAASWAGRLRLGLIGIAAVGALGAAAQINARAFDEYMASRSDLLATNRIIARIETVLADAPADASPDWRSVPLVVIHDWPDIAGPTGRVGTARVQAWSRERIFRFVDRRFVPASPLQREAALVASQGRQRWPARDSVFLHQGVVVVVISR